MDLAALHSLQAHDTSIDQTRHALTHLAERAAVDECRSTLAALRARISDVRRESDALESELATIEERAGEIANHLARLDKQLRTVIAPREAEALQAEMRTLTAEREAGDDRGLAVLDACAEADEVLSRLRADETRADEALAGALVTLTRAEGAVGERLAELEMRRSEVAAAIDADDLSAYEQRRSSFGGVAITRIEHGVCGGCHMDVSASELDAIKRVPLDQVAECPNCSRLLLR